MARPLRIEFPGALYHVMSRGNERQPIVRDDGDRQRRLDWLRRTVETYGWRLHAFVMMTNHDRLFGVKKGSEVLLVVWASKNSSDPFLPLRVSLTLTNTQSLQGTPSSF